MYCLTGVNNLPSGEIYSLYISLRLRAINNFSYFLEIDLDFQNSRKEASPASVVVVT